MKQETFDIEIPFAGFYHSIHDGEIDREIEIQIDYFAEEAGYDIPESLANRLWMTADFGNCRLNYASAYVETFLAEFDLEGNFDGMESPRSYDFGTDRVFAKLSRKSIAKLWRETDKRSLTRIAGERHTSRSGFISLYTPRWRDWGRLSNWDHNQLCTLLTAWLESQGVDWDQWKEFELVEDLNGNGWISEWICESAEYTKTLDIMGYLIERSKRKPLTMADFIAKLRSENRPFDQTPLGSYFN